MTEEERTPRPGEDPSEGAPDEPETPDPPHDPRVEDDNGEPG